MTKRRNKLLLAGVVLVVAAAVAGTVVATRGSDEATVYGLFADANPIIAGDTVRAAGVQVGKVESVTLQNGQARVTMQVDKSVLPLHDDASLSIQPVNLLGEQYIELKTGTDAAPYVGSPVTIPVSRTSRSVSLQQVFNTLNDPTSTALAALVTAMGDGMQGNGQNVAETLKSLGPALTQVDQLGKVLRDQNGMLNDLIDKVHPVAAALNADQGKSLDQLVGSTQQVLSAVASNRASVEQSLSALPATLLKAESTFAAVQKLSGSATPTLQAVRPITDNLTAIAHELEDFSKAANPALATLNPVLQKAQSMLDQARPLVDQLGPAGADLAADAHNLRPVGEMAVNNIDDIMTFVKWWAMSTNGRDGISNYFRGVAVVTPQALLGAVQGALPAAAPAAAPPQPAPGSGQAGSPLPLLGGGGPNGGVTGLTDKQETSMLGQLLGGL
ncbi:MCE family protein [Amycolatopsis sp. K13G38]|uniref:MCE family protein n=1 Tax=Amycolatopsis acididurans TaxID=2724524 RepID=A0ABX1J4D6_9PSEU|nr:MlaD family protein [Amycolatopsis acididurans]NKQ53215.1 MCE family protein [Amycolatopsis acididurans]